MVQAFVDVEIDGWLRLNGLNYHRDGSLKAAQLIQWRRGGEHRYRDALQILNADLAKRLATDILAAIQTHVALLPPEQRMRPPLAPKASRVPPASLGAPPEKPKPSPPPQRKPLPPPARLLARRRILATP
jgi:hypothetical protein